MKKRISVIILTLLILTSTIVNAADFSCTLKMNPSKNTIKAGDTININIVVEGLTISDGAPGLTNLDGYLEYDNKIFEDVKKSDIDCGDNRSVTYDSASKRIYVHKDNDNGVIKNNGVTMFTIKMKVKENAIIENTQVVMRNIVVTDNHQEYTINSISTQLTKEGGNSNNSSDQNKTDGNTSADGNVVDNGNGNTNNGGTNNGGTNNSKTNSGAKNTIKDNTVTKTSTLPKAGLEQYGVVAIIAVLAVAIGSYILYKRYEKNVK